ncbi:MAG: hypothetical protein ACREOJ_07465 [Gemmatimonadaceae bacterium]
MAGMRSPAQIVFDPAGDPLAVRVWCGHAQVGTYDLRLYHSTRGEPVAGWRFHGPLRSPGQDTFLLPEPAGDNLKRVVRCRFRIGVLPPDQVYTTYVTVLQGTRIIGDLVQRGEATDSTVSVVMLAKFVLPRAVTSSASLPTDGDEDEP